jgi:hypothetical protein
MIHTLQQTSFDAYFNWSKELATPWVCSSRLREETRFSRDHRAGGWCRLRSDHRAGGCCRWYTLQQTSFDAYFNCELLVETRHSWKYRHSVTYTQSKLLIQTHFGWMEAESWCIACSVGTCVWLFLCREMARVSFLTPEFGAIRMNPPHYTGNSPSVLTFHVLHSRWHHLNSPYIKRI